jgi:hypothetical protein
MQRRLKFLLVQCRVKLDCALLCTTYFLMFKSTLYIITVYVRFS